MHETSKFSPAALLAAAAICSTSLFAQAPPAAPSLTTLQSFLGLNGANPSGQLVSDANGDLYGTASIGGAFGFGTVFRLAPVPAGSWTFGVLYNFTGALDGGYPGAGLVFDSGSLYGVTGSGGTGGLGTVFQLTSPQATGGQWVQSTIHNFKGGDGGATPYTLLLRGTNGGFWGTAGGGRAGYGVAFGLAPPTTTGGAWTYSVLHTFEGGSDGAVVAGPLTGYNGFLFGVTSIGGAYNNGTVYELMPPATAGGAWVHTVLYSFQSNQDGAFPIGAVIGYHGKLYGTTSGGGSAGFGSVYVLQPPAVAGGVWSERVLYSFKSGSDAATPSGSLVFGTNNALYGTTVYGGGNNRGTIFQLSPPTGSGTWTEYVLHSFTGGFDGSQPAAGVIFGMDGALYGTTVVGGSAHLGTIFQLTL